VLELLQWLVVDLLLLQVLQLLLVVQSVKQTFSLDLRNDTCIDRLIVSQLLDLPLLLQLHDHLLHV